MHNSAGGRGDMVGKFANKCKMFWCIIDRKEGKSKLQIGITELSFLDAFKVLISYRFL